jgi:phosphohistidine phosphatase
MKNLILIRHAKSSWDLPIQDYERDLTTKGIEKSYKVANFASKIIDNKALIWSSFAKRALKTAKIFVDVWNLSQEKIIIQQDLYTFNLEQLEEIVKSCPNEYNNLIIFGHNGAITDFVNKFGNVFIDNVPTSGLVSITFKADNWNTIKKGITDEIIFPRHL